MNFVGCDFPAARVAHAIRLQRPAELFLAKRTKGSRANYRRFTTAAETIRYAVEDLRTPKAFGPWLEVGDRFDMRVASTLWLPPLRQRNRLTKAAMGKARTALRREHRHAVVVTQSRIMSSPR